MTTEGVPDAPDERGRALTKLPASGAVLVRSSVPPSVAVDAYVDVRPGPLATFDGDRLRLPLRVVHREEHHRFRRNELPAVEETIVDLLGDAESSAVRFGDLSGCRRVLPSAAVEAIERRLKAAASRGGGTLVAWTAERLTERSHYEVVID